MATEKYSPRLLQRKLTRRNVLGTAAGASVLAAAYAAFGRSVLEEGDGALGTADEAQVSSDSLALEREEVRVSADDSLDAANKALNGAIELLRRYEDEATPYRSRTAPQFVKTYASDYDHLARVFEWSTAGDDEGGEA